MNAREREAQAWLRLEEEIGYWVDARLALPGVPAPDTDAMDLFVESVTHDLQARVEHALYRRMHEGTASIAASGSTERSMA